METVDIRLTGPQFEAVTSMERRTIFLAGLGSGKTTALAIAVLAKSRVPGSFHGIFAPTRKMINRAVLKTLKYTWSSIGLEEDVDFVVNKRPPRHWNVPPLTLGNKTGIITTAWSSYIAFDGLENFDSQRGQEYDCIFIDEFRDVKAEAIDVLEGRLRGIAHKKLNLPHQLFIFTTPPDNPDHILKLMEKPETKLVRATTFSNEKNLPPGYIDRLRESLSTVQFRREVLAEIIPATESPFAYSFSVSRHVKNTEWLNVDAFVSFDFNITPAVATVWEVSDTVTVCHDEISLDNASIYDVCSEINARYPHMIGEWNVTGDASGWSREGTNRRLSSYYHIIAEELAIPFKKIYVPKSNPTHRDSYYFVNWHLEKNTFVIDPRCKNTIQDLQSVAYSPQKGISKTDKNRGHLLDTVRYLIHNTQNRMKHPNIIVRT